MHSSRGSHRRSGLTPLVFFLLCVLHVAIALPLSQDGANKHGLAVRRQAWDWVPETGRPITEEEYIAYLREYYPSTDKYLFYSGNSLDQLKAFQATNPGHYYYEDFFDERISKHYKDHFMKGEERMDDADASSRAIAKLATKQAIVFGAADYNTLGKNSFYTTKEAHLLQEGVQTGRLQSINHMVKGATNPSQVMVKEDGSGKMTWQAGYKAGTPNNSGSYCKRAIGAACDAPSVNDHSRTSSSLLSNTNELDTTSGMSSGTESLQQGDTTDGDKAMPHDSTSTGDKGGSKTGGGRLGFIKGVHA